VSYSEVKAGAVPAELIAKIKDRGACVIRRTFAPEQADAWGQRSSTTSTRTASTRNWQMLPRTNILARSLQPRRKSTASTGHMLSDFIAF
jgi:hypothetical protein